MSVTGLFSGIGGFELAFSRAGFESGLLVEIDAAARAVLNARFPSVEVRPDVLTLKNLPAKTRILTAGFPCQNLSMAGDKSGISGSKSNVVEVMFDLIERRPPPIVVIENVYFMLQLDSGKAMGYLVQRFEKLGYHWAYRVLDTMGFGLPQRRRRVYFVACRKLDPRTVLFADERSSSTSEKPDLMRPLGFYWTEGRSGVGFTIDGVPPLKVGSSIGIPSPPAVLFPDGMVLTPSLAACERLQGFDSGWTAPADGQAPKCPQWRLVGNAVSVPVAQWVAQRICSPGTVLDFERVPLEDGSRWPNAAWNVGDGRIGIKASDKPILVKRPSIARFRDQSWGQLSDRALDGFIRRAVEGGLWMPKDFLGSLRGAPRKAIAKPANSARRTKSG
jgi:DNA (cytosine-5)-methyltransferase 1